MPDRREAPDAGFHESRFSCLLDSVRWSLSGETGAGDGIRTHDPNLGKVVLYP